jgi:outer membrane protein assembly factor BamB
VSSTKPAPATRGHRLWFPATVFVLAIGGIVAARMRPEFERNFQAWTTGGITLLAILLGLVWFFFLSRFPGRVRLIGFVALALAGLGLWPSVRVDGTVDGRGLPKFAWRWNVQRPVVPTVASTTPAVAPAAPVPGALDVPQFFGPNRDGVVRGVKLARDWKATPPEELWRQPIGSGWSAFAVVTGRAYTQEQRGEDEVVTCYDLLTGKLLWMHANRARFFQWQGGEGPRATPTVDRGHVFAYGATGILDCLDATTGKRLWSREVLKENNLANTEWGLSASPLVFENTVVVTGGATNGPTLLAYHRETGAPLWQAGTDKVSYASPILTTIAGQRVILSVNASTVTAHNAATGEDELTFYWTDDKFPKAAQPVVLPGDQVFLSAGYGMGALLLQFAAGNEGQLIPTQVWKSMRMKTQFNSVTPRDGFLYGLDDGLLACVEIATGERKWKDGRFGSGQTLLVEDLILVQSEPGPVILVAAQPDRYLELGRLPALSSKTWNHPTLAGRYLLVRNDREVVCYRLPVEDANP